METTVTAPKATKPMADQNTDREEMSIMELIDDKQFVEWIRQNFFGDLSDSEFTSQLDKAKGLYTKIRLYYEEFGLELSLESLSALKENFLNETPPSEAQKKTFALTGQNAIEAKPLVGKSEVTLETIDQKLKTLEKRAFWILLVVILIIIIK